MDDTMPSTSGVTSLHLRLRLEAGVRMLDRQHRHQPLAHVVARDGRVLLLEQIVVLARRR